MSYKVETTDKVVKQVCMDLDNRSRLGVKKYKTTLDRQDLNLKDWLQHQYEELLDAALYTKRALKELEKIEVIEKK